MALVLMLDVLEDADDGCRSSGDWQHAWRRCRSMHDAGCYDAMSACAILNSGDVAQLVVVTMGRLIQLFLDCGDGCVTLLCGRMVLVFSSNWSRSDHGHVRFPYGHILPEATTIANIFGLVGF